MRTQNIQHTSDEEEDKLTEFSKSIIKEVMVKRVKFSTKTEFVPTLT